jgi:ATP-dependent helicase/nuclease subunit B
MRLPDRISAALEAGGIILASSPRAARFLKRLHGAAQFERGLRAWRAPEILHWDGWLDRLWQQRLRSGDESRLLLSSAQEHRIWVRLVTPAIESQRLISIDGVAELAQEAYARLCAYDALDFLRGEVFATSDVENFREWARGFERQCQDGGWLSRGMLPLVLQDVVRRNAVRRNDDLAEKAPQRSLILPPRILLTGFDRLTPAQRGLLAACEEAGCILQLTEEDHLSETNREPDTVLVEAREQREEIGLCAQWIRRKLDLAGTENKPFHVAVMVADQSSLRNDIERIFREQLAPGTIGVSAPESPLPFEFSLGVPLRETPMVRAALMLLRWMQEGLRQEELSWLVLSGFLWQQDSDLLPMAELDAAMLQQSVLPLEQDIDSYLRRKGWHESTAAKGLRDRLYAARRAWRKNEKDSLSFAEWVERAQAILSAAGWPGVQSIDAEGSQVRAKWSQVLDSIAGLVFDGTVAGYGEFLRVLERQAHTTIFSPESHGAAIQILGAFESAGMEFDAIWFLGADDATWPAPARPHPFLTLSLQKQRGMPHADNSSDWELAKLVTNRIRKSAPVCIFSYSIQDKDGERRASTVFEPPPKVVSSAWLREQLALAENSLEEEREFPALTVEDEPASGIRWKEERSAGGHSVLKMQAACPFQAFAQVRLRARELGRSDWGLDAMERGNLVHGVLQTLWGELKDRESLLEAHNEGRLQAIIERHVTEALGKYGRLTHRNEEVRNKEPRPGEAQEPEQAQEMLEGSSDNWSGAYLQAERERVVQLVGEWLELERERPPFMVEQQEKSLTARVGDLQLNLRADRIDQVEGGRLLIDYKTGKVNPAGWAGDRPEEPQLPLYAAYGNIEDVRGVVFAQVRSGDFKFDGSVADPALIPPAARVPRSNAPVYSTELRQQWEKVLLALGNQFVAGDAQVDPKRYPKTCEFCPLPGLCRVAEMDRDWVDAESNGFSEEQNGNGQQQSGNDEA